MKQFLLDLLTLDHPFSDQERLLKYKYIFLARMYLIYIAIAIGITIYRWNVNPWVDAIDLGSLFLAISLFYYLKRHAEKVEIVATLSLLAASVSCYGIYLLSLDNRLRLVLFFPLIAFVFYLKGRRIGLAWLVVVIVAILAGVVLPGVHTGYRISEIIVASLYLIMLFFILWNYERISEDQQQREQEYELEKLIAERWKLALEGVGDAVWDWHVNDNSLIYSNSYAKMLGYGEEEIGHDFADQQALQHPDDRVRSAAFLKAFLGGEQGEQYVAEQRLRCKDGSYKWILCRGRVVLRDEAGHPLRMVGTHVDITERKRMEARLKESETRLHLALDSARMGVWDFDITTRKLYWSPEIYRHFDVGDLEPSEDALLNKLVHPDDAPKVRAAMDRSIAERVPYLVEYRIGGPDKLRWVEDRGELQCDELGNPLRMVGTAQDITERKEHEKQLRHIAHYDALTGVPNRVLLADRMAQGLARTKREQGLMAVCYLDLDGFKPVNDSFGHESGDRVLVEITRRIRETIREDDTVARLGGDEFVVLLVGLQAVEECTGSLNRLLEAINQPIEIQGKSLRVSASIGVSLYPDDEQDADTLLRHADQAMYVAKQSGKSRYHFFDAANDQRVRLHHELQIQIRDGLVNGEFELYYQPKVEMRTGRMLGAEALIRWHHPQRGFLPPGEFLRAIENTVLDIELGEWVIDAALAQIRQWQQAGIELGLSINISAFHLQSPGFSDKLKIRLHDCCPDGCQRHLEIEVLETVALDDMDKVGEIIKACKEFGAGFALDDFGTGYSSLTYLSNLDVDTLKIDQSFVHDMLEDKGDHAIVQGTIALAKAFGRGVVAEGVETDAHYQALMQMGCEVGQGYGIARPMPAGGLIEWRANWTLSRTPG